MSAQPVPLAPALPEKVVIVLAAGLDLGQAANATACLAAGLAFAPGPLQNARPVDCSAPAVTSI